MDSQPAQNSPEQQHSASTTPRKRTGDLSYLAQLLPGTTEWPHNDESLTEALKLRQEQERTKQEFYRLENRKRTLEILTMATHAGVPGPAIASMFEVQSSSAESTRAAAVASATAAASAVGQQQPRKLSRSGSPELVNYQESQQKRSPNRFRPTHNRSASSIPAFSTRPVTQAYYPRQLAPQSMSQGIGVYQGSHGSSHGPSSIQFHHWKPNQRPEDKRKIDRSPKQVKQESSPPEQPILQRRLSQAYSQQQQQQKQQQQQLQPAAPLQTQQQQQHQPAARGVPPSPSPGPAIVAAAHQQRRSAHARHRSEATIPSTRNWYSNRGTEEGASILASMASERTKHEVGYILSSEKPQQSYSKGGQGSPTPQNRTLLPPHQGGHPGPVVSQQNQPQQQSQTNQSPSAGPEVQKE